MREERLAEAVAAVHVADARISELRREVGVAADERARAVQRLVDIAGREGAARELGKTPSAIDKATRRAKAAPGGETERPESSTAPGCGAVRPTPEFSP